LATELIIASTSLALGLISGVVMYRSDFCVTAMFRDLFLIRDASMLRYLLVIVVFSMVLFEAGRFLGLIRLYPFPLLGVPSVTTFLAGILFGLGMVLAGGCVVGTLYKMGGGSVLSGVAFLGLLAGSALYAEIHPWWSSLALDTRLGDAVTLPQSMQLSSLWLQLPVLVVGGYLLLQWWRQKRLHRFAYAEGYLQPLMAAIALSVVGFISYVIIGMPLGITTSYAKLGSTLEFLVWPEHVNSLAYFNAVSLNYTPPFSSQLVSGGAGPALDGIAAIQYPLIVGIVGGAFLYATKLNEFKLYYRLPVPQYLSALAGGVILGMSARMVPGCNIWHLWGGLPILANQSLLFLLGLFPGAWLGSLVFSRLVVRSK
jgi:uncharacterized membrane protein YedE/YeeE